MKKIYGVFWVVVLAGIHSAYGFLFSMTGTGDIDLSGEWRFQLDSQDVGISEEWFATTLSDVVQLPGSIQEQGFGVPVNKDTNFALEKLPSFYFDTELLKEGIYKLSAWPEPNRYYIGAAWFQRDFIIPEHASGKMFSLHLERVLWNSSVWIDGVAVGECNSLYSPHEYDFGALTPGQHTVTLLIDNREQVPITAKGHGYTDHTQSIWLGVVGDLALQSRSPVSIMDLQAYGNPSGNNVRVTMEIENSGGESGNGILHAVAMQNGSGFEKEVSVSWTADGGTVDFDLALGSNPVLWDEFSPNLYTLSVELKTGSESFDRRSVTFGLRDFGSAGTEFTVNSRKTMLRGTLDCCIFPLTGYPSTDVASWRHIFETCKAYGLNHVRYHSWCPPEAAFIAADEVGMYLQVEYVWCDLYNGSDAEAQQWVEEESHRVMRAYGNHPSLCMMGVGNENSASDDWMSSVLQTWKADNRHLYTGLASGNLNVSTDPDEVPEYDFCITKQIGNDAIRAKRILSGGADECRFESLPPATDVDYAVQVGGYEKPLISHETAQRCSYPSLKEQIDKYKNGSFRFTNLETAYDRLVANGMLELNEAFVYASGKLQTQLFKEETEGFLRSEGLGGFQHLGLYDFPGQGTALVGVLDAFWDSKGYVTAEEFKRFCGPTVPLVRLPKRVYSLGETLSGTIEIAHYGSAPLTHAVPYLEVRSETGTVLLSNSLAAVDIPVGNGTQIGVFNIDTATLPAMGKYQIAIGLTGSAIENDWFFWVYPDTVSTDPSPTVTVVEGALDSAAKAVLAQGGRVLLLLDPIPLLDAVDSGFATPYWVPGGQVPNTLGILCNPAHPVFADFPTDEYTDWQWWELLVGTRAPVLDDLPHELDPLIRVIDDWNYNRRLGHLFEANVGTGKLMVCTLDLSTDLNSRIVARQLRYSILKYMGSAAFSPAVDIPVETIANLFPGATALSKMDVSVTVDSYGDPYVGENAVDGDPNTIWHTPWKVGEVTTHPHHIIVDLKGTFSMEGLAYLPRRSPENGRIGDYSVYISADGSTWGEPIATGTWVDSVELQNCYFSQATSGRYVKLVSENGTGVADVTAISELYVFFE